MKLIFSLKPQYIHQLKAALLLFKRALNKSKVYMIVYKEQFVFTTDVNFMTADYTPIFFVFSTEFIQNQEIQSKNGFILLQLIDLALLDDLGDLSMPEHEVRLSKQNQFKFLRISSKKESMQIVRRYAVQSVYNPDVIEHTQNFDRQNEKIAVIRIPSKTMHTAFSKPTGMTPLILMKFQIPYKSTKAKFSIEVEAGFKAVYSVKECKGEILRADITHDLKFSGQVQTHYWQALQKIFELQEYVIINVLYNGDLILNTTDENFNFRAAVSFDDKQLNVE